MPPRELDIQIGRVMMVTLKNSQCNTYVAVSKILYFILHLHDYVQLGSKT